VQQGQGQLQSVPSLQQKVHVYPKSQNPRAKINFSSSAVSKSPMWAMPSSIPPPCPTSPMLRSAPPFVHCLIVVIPGLLRCGPHFLGELLRMGADSNVRRSSQTGESTGDRPAFFGFRSSSSYNSAKVTGSQITTVTLSIELI